MNEDKLQKTLFTAGAIFMALFCLLPFAFMAAVSFSSSPEFLLPSHQFSFTLSHYRDITLSSSLHFRSYLLNSMVVSCTSAVLSVTLAALAAFALTRLRMPGSGILLMGVLGVSMFPQISLAGYILNLMTRLELNNTYTALILPYTAWILPLSLWIMASYFSQLPRELDRAAVMDGCTNMQILLKVLIPVAKPGIFAALLLSFIAAFNEFMFALLLTSDHSARTIPVAIALFQGLHGETPWGTIMAASMLSILPVIGLTLLFQRHIIGGLTKGAVKG